MWTDRQRWKIRCNLCNKTEQEWQEVLADDSLWEWFTPRRGNGMDTIHVCKTCQEVDYKRYRDLKDFVYESWKGL